ncbi:helix-turn-helix domain-containing protein [Nocardiopsis terrae]|uniref:helix-turn-helix domain-containing protein n=1 Tax=Streptomyces sp. NPDC057554 TaxID=3350538 RepID=UPI003688314F
MSIDLDTDKRDSLRLFRKTLKEERNLRKWSQTELAEKLGYVRQTVTRAESGRELPSEDFAIRADQVFGTHELFQSLLPSLENAHLRRLKQYVHIEQNEAHAVLQWQPHVVPGLLQTEDYAREMLRVAIPPRNAEEIDRFVASQMQRQQALWRKEPAPITAHFVVAEGALRQLVGGPAMMRNQVRKLIAWAQENRHITLQILPFSAGAHASLQSAYTIIETRGMHWALYVETVAMNQVVTEQTVVSDTRRRLSALSAEALSTRGSVEYLHRLNQEVTA